MNTLIEAPRVTLPLEAVLQTGNLRVSMLNGSPTFEPRASFAARLRLFGLIILLAFLSPVLKARAADVQAPRIDGVATVTAAALSSVDPAVIPAPAHARSGASGVWSLATTIPASATDFRLPPGHLAL